MRPSPLQLDNIRCAWQMSLPPLEVAKALRLVPMTVIREYVRLDESSSST